MLKGWGNLIRIKFGGDTGTTSAPLSIPIDHFPGLNDGIEIEKIKRNGL